MARDEGHEATIGTVRVAVPAVAPLVREYARLGLRVVSETRGQAALQLPCGIVLILSEVDSGGRTGRQGLAA